MISCVTLIPRIGLVRLRQTLALEGRGAATAQRRRGGAGRARGPTDGTYVVEFRTAAGEALAISIPRTEAAVIRHFQARMPYGLFVPDEP
jgi:hypothetical protein